MRSTGAVPDAAVVAASYRAGWAVEFTLATEGGAARYWRWTDVAQETVTISGNVYTKRPLTIEGLPSYGDAAMGEASLNIGDADNVIRLEVEHDVQALRKRGVKVWELLSTGPGVALVESLWYVGVVNDCNPRVDYALFRVRAKWAPWAVVVPDAISAACSARSVSYCDKAATCAHTWPACVANSRTDIFRGDRFLPKAGTTITFRDGVVVCGSNGSTSTQVQRRTR